MYVFYYICIHNAHNILYYVGNSEWMLQDASFEKMGEMMAANGGRLLGMYDELSSFLGKLNLFRGKILDSHELAVFLELYNARPLVKKHRYD